MYLTPNYFTLLACILFLWMPRDSFAETVFSGDTCEDAIVIEDLKFEGTLVKGISVHTTGSLNGANPALSLPECDFSSHPTRWYKTTVEKGAKLIQVYLHAHSPWRPKISIFTEATKGVGCENLKALKLNGESCGTADGSSIAWSVKLEPEHLSTSTEIWIAVSADTLEEIDNADFSFEVYGSKCPKCIAVKSDFCGLGALDIRMTERSTDAELSDTNLHPGEEVRICIKGDLGFSEDKLHGYVPRLGTGWDMDGFDPQSATFTPSGAEWYDIESDCATEANIDFRTLRTYTQNGKLEFCNPICEPCHQGAPIKQGDKLPSGWYYVTEVTVPLGCPKNSCLPNHNWGIQEIGSQFEICFNAKTKVSPKNEEAGDLSITLFPSVDRMTGCWGSRQSEFLDAIYSGAEEWKINSPTSTSEATSKSIVLRPNPVQNRFAIHGLENGSYTIYAVDGTQVQNGVYQNGIDVSKLPKGMYVLRLLTDKGFILSQKLIKE